MYFLGYRHELAKIFYIDADKIDSLISWEKVNHILYM